MASEQVIQEGTSLVIHAMNQAFAANNTVLMGGQAAIAEATRYSYLANKDTMSNVQALGYRTSTESGSGRQREIDSSTPAS